MGLNPNLHEVRLIKRYQNRKLYDTNQSKYVTLEELSHLIRNGINISVIDNKSEQNLTYHTLLQLIFEMEKKAETPENESMLFRLIRHENGYLSTYLKSLEEGLSLGVRHLEEKPRVAHKRLSLEENKSATGTIRELAELQKESPDLNPNH